MRARLDGWLRDHPVVVDAVLAGVLAALSFVTGGSSTWLSVALFAPLVVRRRLPVVSFTVLSLLLLGQAVAQGDPVWGDVALLFGLYAVAAHGPDWARWGGLATGLLGAAIATPLWWRGSNDPANLLIVFTAMSAVVTASWLWGSQVRTRREYVEQQLALAREREQDAATRARLAATDERARIAREMHDVVAHGLSVMVVQADGAAYAARTRPEAATEALGTISETGRRSLTEMRRLLGLLRGDDDVEPQRSPVPGGADLPALVEQVRTHGLPIDLRADDAVASLPAATGLTVYRVVQEALTNSLKHAGPAVHVAVTVRVDGERVRIDVDDDGRGASAVPTGGYGLAGMRERIALHEGTVEAGPRPGGGFRVRASLPTAPEAG